MHTTDTVIEDRYIKPDPELTKHVYITPLQLPVDTIDLKMCCQEGFEAVKMCNSQLDSIAK